MFSEEILARAHVELASAETARSTGFEGRARVCARRAAGIVIRSYLESLGQPVGTRSAYEVLQILRNRAGIADEVRGVIDHLLMRVDKDFQISDQIDLIAETRWLIQTLDELVGP